MGESKRHHYLPRFYLEGFAGEGGRLWVFDRQTKGLRRDRPTNTAVITHYYTAESADGKKNTHIERGLSEVEAVASRIIAKMDRDELITQSEKEELSLFVGLLFGRVPKFERAVQDFLGSIIKRVTQVTFSDRKRAAELIRQLEEETGKLSRITPEEIVDWVRADGFRVKMHRNASLQAMGEVGIELSRHLSAMNWLLVRAPEDHPFVTSDAPFALLPPLNLGQPLGIGIGVTTPGATKLIPLTKRIALLIGDPGPIFAKRKATIEQVSAINAAVACNSFRLVVGPDEDVVRRVIDATMIDRVDP